MKSYNEMAQNVFNRRKEYLLKKRKRQRVLYYSVTSFCVIAVLTIGIYLPNKPQENPLPKPSQTSSLNNSQQTSSLPYINNSSDIESIVTSIPQLETQSSTVNSNVESDSLTQQGMLESSPTEPTYSNPSQSHPNKPPYIYEESTSSQTPPISPPPASSGVPPASSNTSKPSIEYQTSFFSLNQFAAYLPQLNISVSDESKPNTDIPEIITPEPNQGFWEELDGEKQPEDEAPGFSGDGEVTAPAPPSNQEIWDVAKNMFDNGYYNVPYLQSGNELLYLDRIYVQKNTIKYNYRFYSGIPNTTSTDVLSVQLYDYSIQSTYSSYLKDCDCKVLNYNGITYTAFRMDEYNMYDASVIWQQNGFWCRANYRGDDMYLSSIIPNLYLVQLPWNN